jgi:hypothetical protein
VVIDDRAGDRRRRHSEDAQRPQEPPTTYGLKGTSETGRFVRIPAMNRAIVCQNRIPETEWYTEFGHPNRYRNRYTPAECLTSLFATPGECFILVFRSHRGGKVGRSSYGRSVARWTPASNSGDTHQLQCPS